MPREVELSGTTIVLVGSFNPRIFHPVWFADQNLLAPEDAEAATIDAVLPEVTTFSLGWLTVQVTPDRFVAGTLVHGQENALRDLVAGTFAVLAHTPVTMLGVNRHEHLPTSGDEIWSRVGEILAPVQPWQGILEQPHARSVSMRGARNDGFIGWVEVRVEASAALENGIFIQVNDHVQVDPEPGRTGLPILRPFLIDHWGEAQARGDAIVQRVKQLWS